MINHASGQAVAALQTGVKHPLQLGFTDRAIQVQGGCNAQFGGYALQSGTVQIQGLASTMKACAPALMQLDQAVAARLKGEMAARVEGDAHSPVLVLSPQVGPWHPLMDSIRGYTHPDGMTAILRVKRYDWKNPPADASSILYVLDLVVQQGR